MKTKPRPPDLSVVEWGGEWFVVSFSRRRYGDGKGFNQKQNGKTTDDGGGTMDKRKLSRDCLPRLRFRRRLAFVDGL